jgi:uncharacterized protein YjdB
MRILLTLAALGILACDRTPTAAKVDTAASPDQCLSGAVVHPASATLLAGDTVRLSVSACNGSPALGGTFGWHSSNPAIASVDSLSGLVHARAVGSATIIASQISDQTLKGAAAITVAPRQ